MTTPELGLIEGFFGKPWSWAARRDAVTFLAPHGYGFYLYAPKADAYLRRRWQTPHPNPELEALARLAEHCRNAGVRFGVGLSPFELHLAPASAWRELLENKLASLAAVGIEDLAIMFDDMRGDAADLAERQAAIVDFAAGRSSASWLLCCPSYYSDDPVLDHAFGPRPAHYLEALGRLLDPAIEIMWTGEEVCSREISVGHVSRVSNQLGRRPFLWDNYPVNDGPRMSQHLHLRGFTGRPAELAGYVSGHGISVASQPVLTRIPALTLAASYRVGDRYAYGAAFDEAAATVLGEDLARVLRIDLLALQDTGLGRLAERHAILRRRYAGFDHPAAQEIVAWLDGEFAVGEELVRTQ